MEDIGVFDDISKDSLSSSGGSWTVRRLPGQIRAAAGAKLLLSAGSSRAGAAVELLAPESCEDDIGPASRQLGTKACNPDSSLTYHQPVIQGMEKCLFLLMRIFMCARSSGVNVHVVKFSQDHSDMFGVQVSQSDNV